MLKLAIAFVAMVAVLSTIVTAINQVIQSTVPLRGFWLRGRLNLLVRRLEIHEERDAKATWREWFGWDKNAKVLSLMDDLRVNPTGMRAPEWVDPESVRQWLGEQFGENARPEYLVDPERFTAWWGRIEHAMIRGYKRALLAMSAVIGIAITFSLGLDPVALFTGLQGDPVLVNAMVARQDMEISSDIRFAGYRAAFRRELLVAEATEGEGTADPTGALVSLAALYYRASEATTLAGKAADVVERFDALCARFPDGMEPSRVMQTAWQLVDAVVAEQAVEARATPAAEGGLAAFPSPFEESLLAELPLSKDHPTPEALVVFVWWAAAEDPPREFIRMLASPEMTLAASLPWADLESGRRAARVAWDALEHPEHGLVRVWKNSTPTGRPWLHLLGMLVLGLAIGFGAPFWFDLLATLGGAVRGRAYRDVGEGITPPVVGTKTDNPS